MDEQKKGVILNIIINELVEKIKNKTEYTLQEKRMVNLRDIILEMENRLKVS